MSVKFNEYKNLDLTAINKAIAEKWETEDTFKKTLEKDSPKGPFVFYEGPPSANGMPGIHHVMARAIKDVVCRYKTQKGYKVDRKAGWDTHGLPVELSVEKSLGITKEDIGKKITVTEYNEACRKEVMKYTKEWAKLTGLMGYWVDMENPYITYDNKYIESVWWLLKELYKKDLLYKGYTIQPYSPAAGTGLSSHELNQPGCYRDVKDTTCVAQFKVIRNDRSEKLFDGVETELFFMAWTTTPWTLPSNTALAIGGNITYVKVRSFNPYTGDPITVILAKDRMNEYFKPENADLDLQMYEKGDKKIPFKIVAEYKGEELKGTQYEQLIDWVKPVGKAFEVLVGDFVTTEDGTGIVHIAPTFGADDYRVAQQHDVAALLIEDKEGNQMPMVDRKGRMTRIEDMSEAFVKNQVNIAAYNDFAGRFVKNAYDETLDKNAPTLDVDICVNLKKENKAFKIEKHIHNYPHCWRTDKPVLYYPLDSWFIKTTAVKDRLIELNETINWKPESTGSGRFGKWLENLVDWNLSRSRYWGTPLPIWRTDDCAEEKCIGSAEELSNEIKKSIEVGFMDSNPFDGFEVNNFSKENYSKIEFHRHVVDEITLVSDKGKPMKRENDLIDVWFDSGAMPYAQFHYPFEITKEVFEDKYPADFIAEGVDQTRGWFFTLHAIATMLFDSVSFKNIISNGLVLDKKGNKMSKRLGNAVDPFITIEKYGSDPLRWYMLTNAQPWDNLKFDLEGVDEVKRKFFGTLYNTYSFFALYANVDGFDYSQEEVSLEKRPEIDQWIISLLNTLIKDVDFHYNNFEPTKAGRAIQEFVMDNLSNWYVRLNRKRFWGGEFNEDKIAAYQTLYTCIETIAMLMAPISPFFAEQIFDDCNTVTKRHNVSSVHHSTFPTVDEKVINKDLEERMDLAQKISSMVLSLRRKVNIKVRQPLNKIMVPALSNKVKEQIRAISSIIQTEVNIKEIEFIGEDAGILIKSIKPDFKKLGPKFGKQMKNIANTIKEFGQEDIKQLEQDGTYQITIEGETIEISIDDVEITSQDIPGWLVANEGNLTVALDITVTQELKSEGIARELINRIQNIRKDSGYEVTDKILIRIENHPEIVASVGNHKEFISSQTLAKEIESVEKETLQNPKVLDLDENLSIKIEIIKA